MPKLPVKKAKDKLGVAWVPDDQCQQCQHCQLRFTKRRRRHHCRHCGQIFCGPWCATRSHTIRATSLRCFSPLSAPVTLAQP